LDHEDCGGLITTLSPPNSDLLKTGVMYIAKEKKSDLGAGSLVQPG
jgi:hypothetical protein